MTVKINELTREVKTTEVVGRTYTVTMSAREAALITYLLGATIGTGTDRLWHALRLSSVSLDRDELKHTRHGAPGIHIPGAARDYINSLSNKVTA